MIFDLCDNHFYNPSGLPRYERARREMLAMIKQADRVTCSTAPLAAAIAEVTGGQVAPTVISDIAERVELEPLSEERAPPFNLLWFGSHGSPNAPSGMADLLIIRDQLERMAKGAALQLIVCSDSRAKFDEIVAPFDLPTRFVEWSIDRQQSELARADVVVLPLTINPFTACKTHNRLSSALYSGRPVVATAIDSYREFAAFCTLDDWDGGLRRCLEDPVGEAARAASAKPYIDKRYSEGAIAPLWEDALDLTPPKIAKRASAFGGSCEIYGSARRRGLRRRHGMGSEHCRSGAYIGGGSGVRWRNSRLGESGSSSQGSSQLAYPASGLRLRNTPA